MQKKPTPQDIKEDAQFQLDCLKLADIAKAAAEEVILPSFRSADLKVLQKTGVQDLVTEADEHAERYMAAQISEVFPNAVVLGEESVAANPELLDGIDAHDLCVIIDPIDGTFNYAHGITTFGIAIAVLIRGVTVYGLLCDPIMKEITFAFLGMGAYKKPILGQIEPLQVSSGKCGFIPLASLPSDKVSAAVEFGHTHSPLKSLGCSVHEYRLLCDGSASWALATKSAPWDHAAGQLIHSEAGGITRFADGEDYRAARHTGAIISAPNEDVWKQLQKGFSDLI